MSSDEELSFDSLVKELGIGLTPMQRAEREREKKEKKEREIRLLFDYLKSGGEFEDIRQPLSDIAELSFARQRDIQAATVEGILRGSLIGKRGELFDNLVREKGPDFVIEEIDKLEMDDIINSEQAKKMREVLQMKVEEIEREKELQISRKQEKVKEEKIRKKEKKIKEIKKEIEISTPENIYNSMLPFKPVYMFVPNKGTQADIKDFSKIGEVSDFLIEQSKKGIILDAKNRMISPVGIKNVTMAKAALWGTTKNKSGRRRMINSGNNSKLHRPFIRVPDGIVINSRKYNRISFNFLPEGIKNQFKKLK